MITTFHIGVCLVQYIWEHISYFLFEPTNSNQDLDNSNHLQNNTNSEIDKEIGCQNVDSSIDTSLIEPRHGHNLMLPSSSTKSELYISSQESKEQDDVHSQQNNTSSEIDNENGCQNNVDNIINSSHIEPIFRHNSTFTSLGIESELKTSSEENKEQDDEHEVIQTILFEDLANVDIRKLIYDVKPTFECICDERGMRFIPPVYIQRYIMVESILKEPCWASTVKKIVDFGCAELKFENLYLKKLPGIEEIIAVDLDEKLLTYYSCILSPSIPDFLQRRPSPLKIKILCGSVAHTNEALVGCDAVVAIELIEHLYPADLENLPFTVFGFIKPSVAIFTTPNADFNVLFTNFSGFRHYDHKFEWTRQEFEDWANNLTSRYPEYSVTFQGVGPGPPGTDHLGCCSQMATFVKLYGSPSTDEFEMHTQDGDYKLINEYIYPYEERTREEIIRDDAIAFINNCIFLNKKYDEDVVKEIHLKKVMERSKCFSREKLKNILRENNWQVETNEDGCEVIIVPDSDSEDDVSSYRSEEYNEQGQNVDFVMEFSNVDENWDIEESKSKNCSNSTSNFDLVNCDNERDKNTCHDSLVYSCIEVGSGCEASDSNLDLNTSNYRSDTYSEKELVKDCSIYETPYNNGLQIEKSNSQLPNKSSHDQDIIVGGCNKALVFGTPDSYNEYEIDKTLLINDSHVENEKSESFCCLDCTTMASDERSKSESSFSHDNVVSPFNTSVYTTPCCSKFHKNNTTKSLSLQEIKSAFGPSNYTEVNSLSKLPDLTLEQRGKISKSMEGFKTQDSCDTEKTSNDSKVVDSGYLDSCSENNINLDLTPEQFDELETESEGNCTSSQSSSPLVPPIQILPVIDHVENGDVVNNNRDGEGNNMVADIEEEFFDFEAQIEQINNDIPNVAPGNQFHLQEINHYRDGSLSPDERSVDMEVECLEFEAKIEGINIDLDTSDQHTFQNFGHCNKISTEQSKILEKSVKFNSQIKDVSGCGKANEPLTLTHQKFDNFSNKSNSSHENCFLSPNFCDENSILNSSLLDVVLEENKTGKPSSILNFVSENLTCQSDLCNARNNSECHLNSSKSKMINCSSNGSINQNGTNHESSELVKYNSLTTVIDGCSKFSECSLVHPIHIFPNWMQRINIYEFENESCEKIDSGNNILNSSFTEEVDLNIISDYESAISLQSEAEDFSFPKWLLNINLTEIENFDLENEVSETSVRDIDSFEDLSHPNYEQVDTRAGGDQDSTL